MSWAVVHLRRTNHNTFPKRNMFDGIDCRLMLEIGYMRIFQNKKGRKFNEILGLPLVRNVPIWTKT
jgi:hypothetical protein